MRLIFQAPKIKIPQIFQEISAESLLLQCYRTVLCLRSEKQNKPVHEKFILAFLESIKDTVSDSIVYISITPCSSMGLIDNASKIWILERNPISLLWKGWLKEDWYIQPYWWHNGGTLFWCAVQTVCLDMLPVVFQSTRPLFFSLKWPRIELWDGLWELIDPRNSMKIFSVPETPFWGDFKRLSPVSRIFQIGELLLTSNSN